MNSLSVNTHSSLLPLKCTYTVRFIVVILCVIGGCGRRGSLEPPPDDSSKDKQSQSSDVRDAAPFGFKKPSARVPLKASNTSFFLDSLLGSKPEPTSKSP